MLLVTIVVLDSVVVKSKKIFSFLTYAMFIQRELLCHQINTEIEQSKMITACRLNPQVEPQWAQPQHKYHAQTQG